MPADIFAFAITMYEVFGWCNAYPKSQFKFPWKIAEFIIDGCRLKQLDDIIDEEYQLICKCWCHDPKERIKVDEVVSLLESFY